MDKKINFWEMRRAFFAAFGVELRMVDRDEKPDSGSIPSMYVHRVKINDYGIRYHCKKNRAYLKYLRSLSDGVHTS